MNFGKSSFIFRIIIIIILFSFNSFNAQQSVSNDDVKITLGKGVKLYSADKSFNEQIVHEKIIVENANVSYEKIGHHNVLIVSSLRHSQKLNFVQQVKVSEENKRKEAVKHIKKKIDDYEARSKSFENQNYHGSPSPSQFYSSNSSSKNYIAPSHNTNDFSKIYSEFRNYSVTHALDFLHSQKYTYYNNKSLDFCFSEVFSVRPPPVLEFI